MDIQEIMEVLPHRPPFLLIDRVLEMDLEAKRIVAIKNLTATEGYFQGHFPNRPVMPGVLQLEVIAQAAGILLNKAGGYEGRIAFFTSVDRARFRRMVGPGDSLLVTAELVQIKSFLCKVKGRITVDIDGKTEKVCDSELSFAFGRD